MIEFSEAYVLFTPRTGSRSLEKFLLEWTSGKNVQPHHTPVEAVVNRNTVQKLNYVVAREPRSQMESWFNGFNRSTTCSMSDFIKTHARRSNYQPLNMYMDIINFDKDRVFIYEDGLEVIIQELTYVFDEDLPVIGKSDKPPYNWTDEDEQTLYDIYKQDFVFYAKALLNRQLVLSNPTPILTLK